jgi:hypothetical protein
MRSNLLDIFVECGRLEGHLLSTLMQEPLATPKLKPSQLMALRGGVWWALV